MNVHINGQPTIVADSANLKDLLATLGYQDLLVAVALNRACVRRVDLAVTCVQAGDEIEILAPMAGG